MCPSLYAAGTHPPLPQDRPKAAMRTTPDRIRHAISFELFGLILVTPLGARLLGFEMLHIGVVVVASATMATVWTYLYNLGFDHAMRRLAGHTRKSVLLRVGHALLFEIGLLLLLMPFIAWYLGVSWLEAFLIDLGFAGFYVVYAFAFNWAYDLVFPVPETAPKPGRAST